MIRRRIWKRKIGTANGISKSLWKSFYKHVEKSKKCKHFQIWENVILNQRWKRKSTKSEMEKKKHTIPGTKNVSS